MTPRRPLDDVELLLVDGNNLLHRLHGSADGAALRSLLPRLRAALAPAVQAIVVLDGHAAPGSASRQRISGSLEVRHAGSTSADDAIVGILAARPYTTRARTVVVSDDRSLVERSRAAGGRTQRLDWLVRLMAGPARGARAQIGGARHAPRPPANDDDERPSWQPGRGATRKKGNPKRGRRPDGRTDRPPHRRSD